MAAKDLVNHAHHSGPFLRAMREYCSKNNHTYTKLSKSVKTRWNSNYDMVNRLVKHNSCIQGMENDQVAPKIPIIENSQWRILKQYKDILAPIKHVTKVWESEIEPTMSTVGEEIFNLKEGFEEVIRKDSQKERKKERKKGRKEGTRK